MSWEVIVFIILGLTTMPVWGAILLGLTYLVLIWPWYTAFKMWRGDI